MASHVEQQIAARIARVQADQARRKWQRAELDEQRAAGLEARKRNKLRRIYCGQCARPQRRGTYLRCPLGCGTALCRKRASCGNSHLQQCPRRNGVPSLPGEGA